MKLHSRHARSSVVTRRHQWPRTPEHRRTHTHRDTQTAVPVVNVVGADAARKEEQEDKEDDDDDDDANGREQSAWSFSE